MALRLDKYAIAGIVGVVFFISLGIYGLQEEKIEKKVQIDYQELLISAQERVSTAETLMNRLQSECSEHFKNEKEEEYKRCKAELNYARNELTSAQVDLFDIKSKLDT